MMNNAIVVEWFTRAMRVIFLFINLFIGWFMFQWVFHKLIERYRFKILINSKIE